MGISEILIAAIVAVLQAPVAVFLVGLWRRKAADLGPTGNRVLAVAVSGGLSLGALWLYARPANAEEFVSALGVHWIAAVIAAQAVYAKLRHEVWTGDR